MAVAQEGVAQVPTIEGTVERIVFRNEESGYSVVRLATDDRTRLFRDDLVTIVGTLPNVSVGEILECTGDWEQNTEHGRQLRVKSFLAHTPISPKALARYLGSGIIKGIGPKTADRLADHFGAEMLAAIELEPERLTEVKGISPAKRDAIVAGWAQQLAIRDIMVFLQEYGVSPALGRKIYDQYGREALNTIRTNPYQLEQDIHGVGFRTADAIAVKLGLPRDSLPRLATGIKYALTEAASSDGHCYLPREDALVSAAILLDIAPALLPAALALSAQQKEVFVDADRVYLAPFFYSEIGVARRIKRILSAPSSLPPLRGARWEMTLKAAEEAQGVPLAERQRASLAMAYHNKVSILTGGPGTGKTTTIRALVHILDEQQITYGLAAPTGRAARRMSETTGRPARTLHRLLEFNPSSLGFLRNQEHPLPYEFLIVDEVSMIDLVLMYNLLKSIDDHAHVLFVGDADQLPSVGAGNVLHDLLASTAIPIIQLNELFRQAAQSRIIVAAHAIREGEMPVTTPEKESDFFYMPTATPEAAAGLILDLATRRLPTRYGVDPVRDIQVLAPIYRGAAGVDALNDGLQSRLRRDVDGPTVVSGARTFHIGDKVMQTRNDYDKNVFNGDVGIITIIEPHDALMAVTFGEDEMAQVVTYAFHELDELTLAYAISIHRAQGSEYPIVVIPLVMQHSLLLQRNLLYTAITRAKRLCVIVGDHRALWKAVHNDEVAKRNTALGERLATGTVKIVE